MTQAHRPSPADRECIRLVAAMLGSSRAEVCSRLRDPAVIRARWACMVALRRRGLSYPEIGKALGGKDHTTAMHAVDLADNRYSDDLAWLLAVDEGVRVSTPKPRSAASMRWGVKVLNDPREAIVDLLSEPGRVPAEACRAALVLLSLAAGLPVPAPADATAADQSPAC